VERLREIIQDNAFWHGAIIAALLFTMLWQFRKPVQTFTIYDGAKVDSLQTEISLRDLEVAALRDSLALLHYRDSLIKHRTHEMENEHAARLDSIYAYTDADIRAWLCARYGHKDSTLCAH